MSEPGDLSQAIAEEGGPEQERTTPENGIVKSESLDEEEKLELQVRGETVSQAIVYSSCFSLLDCCEGLLSSFLQKSLTRRMTRRSIKLSSPFPNIGHSFLPLTKWCSEWPSD